MQEEEFSQIIDSISDELWQEHLSIGNVESVKIEKIIQSKYSRIAKCVVRGSNASSNIYVKVYKNDKSLPPEEISRRIQADYQTLNYYYDRFKRSDRFGVVKPVLFLPDRHALITQEAAGKTLYHIISQSCKYFAPEKKLKRVGSFMNRVGAWLRYFQSLDNSQPEQYSVKTLVEYIIVRLNILVENLLMPDAPLYRDRIMDYFERNQGRVECEELYLKPSHNDFNLGNIIIQNDLVTVLDFSKIRRDSFLVDLSRIYHQLFLMTFKFQYRKNTIKGLQGELLEGFEMPDADQLMLFRFLLIRHTLTHLLGVVRSRERSLTAKMYNRWVINRELRFLNSILSDKGIRSNN